MIGVAFLNELVFMGIGLMVGYKLNEKKHEVKSMFKRSK